MGAEGPLSDPAGRGESEARGSSEGGAVNASSAPVGKTEIKTRGPF